MFAKGNVQVVAGNPATDAFYNRAPSSFTFGGCQCCQHIIMKISSCIFNPLRSSSTHKAIRSNELWHRQQQDSRRAMDAMTVRVFRKQKDDSSSRLGTSSSRSRNVLLISYHRGRNFRRRALSIHSIPVAVRDRLFSYVQVN
jgi:hypothetical protein